MTKIYTGKVMKIAIGSQTSNLIHQPSLEFEWEASMWRRFDRAGVRGMGFIHSPVQIGTEIYVRPEGGKEGKEQERYGLEFDDTKNECHWQSPSHAS
jgi:hypothetical protein